MSVIFSKIWQYKALFILLLTGIMAACHANKEWENVEYDSDMICSEMITHCEKEREIYQKAHVYIEQDTLFIRFFDLSNDWRGVIVKVHEGKFSATAFGASFLPFKMSYTTLEQRLQLGKKHYAVGDTLCGYCDFRFQSASTPLSQDREEKEETVTYSFRGAIREVVRTEDFNPFDEANVMTFDLPTALLELGEPLYREKFNTLVLPEFRIELLNQFPSSEEVWIEEATWDISPTREVSDEGVDRLTVWYVQTDGIQWKPVKSQRWSQYTQF